MPRLLTEDKARETWRTVRDASPPPHKKYVVRRNGVIFTATVCYGMHHPWWIQKAIDGTEFSPEDMHHADEWLPFDAVKTPNAAIAARNDYDSPLTGESKG